ncbi:MAG: CBS domain-containing protein [Rhodospirillales bacterium]|nr:CBS domain-containing protein [Alphaproteobacteria bacterium]MCB9987626.1 CBS domain-containing protein [Rhodospirillales bacterium]USO08075.1 MAG: CBS domain-containing protein [Rhodospirillales bacterium]
MPCSAALIKAPVCVKEDVTVKDAMALMSGHGLRTLPVMDGHGRFVGMFGLNVLLDNLLPVSVRMQDGLERLDFLEGASPGVAKRLLKLEKKRVSELMISVADLPTIHAETAIWEGIRMMVVHGSPLAAVDPQTGLFQGLLSEQSVIANLEHVIEEMEKTPDVYFHKNKNNG